MIAPHEYFELTKLFMVAQTPLEVILRTWAPLIAFTFLGLSLGPTTLALGVYPILGQIFAVLYILLRSLIQRWTPFDSSIEFFEIFCILVSVFLIGLKRIGWRAFFRDFSRISVFCIVLCSFILLIVTRFDWPLPWPRSGDVLTFEIQAHILKTLGRIPWSLEPLGPSGFSYPAGFASLNAAWMTFSGLSAQEILPLQVVFQITFCLGLLCSWIFKDHFWSWEKVFLGIGLSFVLFFAFPYSYLTYPDGAGLGRTCTLAFLALGLCCLQIPRQLRPVTLISMVIMMLMALNPTCGIVLALLFLASKPQRFEWVCGGLFLAVLVLGDPYYFHLFQDKAIVAPGMVTNAVKHELPLEIGNILSTPSEFFRELYKVVQNFPEKFFDNGISKPGTLILFLILSFIFSRGKTLYWKWVWSYFFVTCLVVALISPSGNFLPGTLRFRVDKMILELVWIAQMAGGLLAGYTILSKKPSTRNLFQCCGLFWLLTLPHFSNVQYLMKRESWLPEGWDRISQKFLSEVKEWKQRQSYVTGPKVVLVPSRSGNLTMGQEKWVGALNPYTVYSFVSNTYVVFQAGHGSPDLNGALFEKLGMNEIYDEKGAQLRPFSPLAQKWIHENSITVWPPMKKFND